MAGLAEAASVIAVIQLSTKIIKLCVEYSQEVSNAREDIARIHGSITSTLVVLEGIKQLLNNPNSHGKLVVSNQLSSALSSCQTELEAIEKQLDLGKSTKSMNRFGKWALNFKWPFQSKEIDRLVKHFKRYTQTFTNAVVVDQTTILLDNSRKADSALRNASLSKLPFVGGASYDAHDEEHNATCLGNTRFEIRDLIAKWAVDPDGKPIFWLNGMAGTGKSTIARTVASSFAQQGILGASFFFKRGAGDRASGNRLFTTIAWQLTVHFPALARGVADAIDADATLPHKNFKEQFDKLIVQPLCTPDLLNVPDTVLIVIDALDECEREEDVRAIVKLLAHAKDATSTRIRVFLTSRPELPIRLGFKTLSASTYDDFVLHEVAVDTVKRDIEAFLRHEFKEIKELFGVEGSWPEESAIEQLVHLAIPLFIFAATVCRYLCEPAEYPTRQLDIFLKSAVANKASGMETTYLPVLQQLLAHKNAADQARVARNFRETVGAIVLLEAPLSRRSLAVLFHIDEKEIDFRLRQLHSVLDIPSEPTVPIRLFHLSFRDFLLQGGVQGDSPFQVHEAETQKNISDWCIALLIKSPCLKQDICAKRHPGVQRSDIANAEIDKALPPEIQYACRYWVHHLKGSLSPDMQEPDFTGVFNFLHDRFLYWLEALSLIGCARESIVMIQTLLSVLNIQNSPLLFSFIKDARRFTWQNISIIEQAPLQLYSSALMFAPERSIVRTTFRHLIPKWISQMPRVEEDWSACLQKITGHQLSVASVAFSPDGQKIVSGSQDKTVKLWDATGAPLCTLEGHTDRVNAVVFSPDGHIIASASADKTVKLWDVTGELRVTLAGHEARITSVAFSPGGQIMASGSADGTIKLWDMKGALRSTMKVGTDCFSTMLVEFSPNGRMLASADKSSHEVQFWDPLTGALRNTLPREEFPALCVAFSPNSEFLAVGNIAGFVELWDLSAGMSLHNKLKCHAKNADVVSLSFSPDGQTLAIGSEDKTIRLWDVSAGGTWRSTLRGTTDTVVPISFSPNGQTIVSGSSTGIIRLWDVQSGGSPRSTLQSQLDEHFEDNLRSMEFFLDGQIVVSYHWDKVLLWNGLTGQLLDTIHDVSYGAFSFQGSETSPPLPVVDSDRFWITWKGRGLLWLPPEYRVKEHAVYGSKVALVRGGTKDIKIIDFDVSTLA